MNDSEYQTVGYDLHTDIGYWCCCWWRWGDDSAKRKTDLSINESVGGKFDVGKAAFAECDTVHRIAPDALYLLAHSVPLCSRRRRPVGDDGGGGRAGAWPPRSHAASSYHPQRRWRTWLWQSSPRPSKASRATRMHGTAERRVLYRHRIPAAWRRRTVDVSTWPTVSVQSLRRGTDGRTPQDQYISSPDADKIDIYDPRIQILWGAAFNTSLRR